MSDEAIVTISLKDKDNLLAVATVSFETVGFGYLTIKDFVIWRSDFLHPLLQEYINIEPSTKKFYGKRSKRVFLEDPKQWERLQQLIYDAYHLKRSKSGKPESKKEDEINPDDIPF